MLVAFIMSHFQSYLTVGRGDKKREKTTQLAKSAGVDLTKVSPDVFIISPLKKTIGIDEIRELKKHIFQKPVKDKFKFVVIEQAEKLTQEAQNALLKIFEEPPGHAIIVLESTKKSQILPTIQSRAIIKRVYDDKFQNDEINLIEENETASLLEKISKIENPADWLDNQIIILYNQLKNSVRANQSSVRAHPHASSAARSNGPATSDVAHIRDAIEECAKTKAMVDANVNPKFALANLIFSTHFNNSN